MKRIIRASTSPEVTPRELKNRALARQICAEGIVLLENNGVLPLKNKKVAAYGYGVRRTGTGGLGSGETRPREIVNIEQGLLNAGVQITSQKWLNDYDAEYTKKYDAWKIMITEGLKKCPTLEQMDFANQNMFQTPYGRDITADDVKASNTDIAIYVLTRQTGEAADRKEVPGDFLVMPEEVKHLQTLCRYYQNVVLILNVGGMMDLSFTEELPLAAIVHLTQGGMESGNGLADVLTGKVSPSGKMADTWAVRYADYPCADTFAYCNGDTLQEDYNEGIYVGYRYFDSFRVAPRYPFGYGLSYTSFEMGQAEVSMDGTTVNVCVPVTNTGAAYAGKEVVQIYVSSPDGRMEKEYQSLRAFAKTRELKPGETETVKLTFPMESCASFDMDNGAWVLEAGDYVLRVGNSSVGTKAAALLRLDKEVWTQKVDHVCPLKKKLDLLQAPAQPKCQEDIPVVPVASDAFTTKTYTYKTPEAPIDPKVDAIMKKLTLKDMSKLVVGAGFVGPVYNTTFGAIGRSTSVLLKKGIQNMNMSDGPQGLNLIQRSLKPKQNFMTVPTVPEVLQYGFVKMMLDATRPKENEKRTVYYQFCTAWPCSTMVAQTWNAVLAEELGKGTGAEMMETGVSCWLAPGMNLHRNVMCGRNFEYYSEDPFLTGKMAAAVVRGAQSHKGCYATPKHFACNNQETNRQQVSSNVNERTLREIYLKGFEIMVREADPKALMSSYNRINEVYCNNNYDLLTKVLRNEWGFSGFVMTDWFATGENNGKDELGVMAGNDLLMPGTGKASMAIVQAVKDGVISQEDVERSARRMVYATVHSNMYD